jgi:very-short-patch-repair endonuclease
MIRDLTEDEMAFINEQPINRTDSEVKAYRLLPKSLKMDVERNQPIAFTEGGLCRPDFLWRYKRICLEIDGGCHKFKVRHDNIKNWVFRKNGFIVIRIVNMDVRVNVCFWQRLLDGLKVYKYERPELEPILNELQEMIDNEIQSWTQCEDYALHLMDGGLRNDTMAGSSGLKNRQSLDVPMERPAFFH